MRFAGQALVDLLTAFSDTIAPQRCLGCLVEGVWLCAQCREQLPPPRLRCVACGRGSARGSTCAQCRPQILLDGCVSAGTYSTPALQRGIEWLKFKGVRRLAPVLASLIIPRLTCIAPLAELQRTALLIPLPLHARRLRQRGFNQSFDLAQALSSYTDIPLSPLLVRTRATWAQARLPKKLRGDNIQGAFALATPPPAHVQHCLLVDDVTTTGSTLSAAAAVLRTSDVREVWGVTVAHG